ncbi:RNase H domain-containing protein, partial [Trichonephila clavata]
IDANAFDQLATVELSSASSDKTCKLSQQHFYHLRPRSKVEKKADMGLFSNCPISDNKVEALKLSHSYNLRPRQKLSRKPTASSSELQASEVQSLFTGTIKTIWTSPPEYAWYDAKCQGLSLQCTCSRLAQTTLPRLRTGHIKSLIFNGSEKTYASCRCSAMASHIIACIDASVGQLLNEEDVVFNLTKRHAGTS